MISDQLYDVWLPVCYQLSNFMMSPCLYHVFLTVWSLPICMISASLYDLCLSVWSLPLCMMFSYMNDVWCHWHNYFSSGNSFSWFSFAKWDFVCFLFCGKMKFVFCFSKQVTFIETAISFTMFRISQIIFLWEKWKSQMEVRSMSGGFPLIYG